MIKATRIPWTTREVKEVNSEKNQPPPIKPTQTKIWEL